jgi:hypothetical protein
VKGEVINLDGFSVEQRRLNEDFGQGSQKEFEARYGLREQTVNHFFTYTRAQGSFSRFRGQAMGVYKLCRFNFKGKTLKG